MNPATFARTNEIFGKKKAVEIVNDPATSRTYSNYCAAVFLDNHDDDDDGDDDGDLDDDSISSYESCAKRRLVELIVMPSTTPSNALVRPPEKEKTWHMGCYRLEEPRPHYECPGCEYYLRTAAGTATSARKKRHRNPKTHWLHDCPYREDWKSFKKEQKNKKKSKDEIDPFFWYV